MHDHTRATTTATGADRNNRRTSSHATLPRPAHPTRPELAFQSSAGNGAMVQLLGQAGHPWARSTGGTAGGGTASVPSAHAVQRRPMETRKTRLYEQQGPSCWLFVLQALAEAHGMRAKHLKLAMHAYPEEEDLTADSDGRRLEAVQRMTENLANMVAELQYYRESSHEISKEAAEELAQRTGTLQCIKIVKFTTFTVGRSTVKVADVDELIDAFGKARRRSARLLAAFQTSGAKMETVLGDDKQKVKATSSKESVTSKLRKLRDEMPVYLSVRKKYEPRPEDYPDPTRPAPDGVYWDDRQDPMVPTKHALLLTGYRKGLISYKDPNFGNFEIRINIDQFMEMTGDKYVTIRSFDQNAGMVDELAD